MHDICLDRFEQQFQTGTFEHFILNYQNGIQQLVKNRRIDWVQKVDVGAENWPAYLKIAIYPHIFSHKIPH